MACIHCDKHPHCGTHVHMHFADVPSVPSDNRSTIATMVGGVVGGLVALGIIVLVSLIFGITVAVKLRKQGKYSIIVSTYNDNFY